MKDSRMYFPTSDVLVRSMLAGLPGEWHSSGAVPALLPHQYGDDVRLLACDFCAMNSDLQPWGKD